MALTLHTTFGALKLELYPSLAPLACENFLALAASGYYNNTIFHKNVPGFIVQGGDPTGKGKGGMSIWGKPFQDEITSTLKHEKRGVLSMANSGKPHSNKSQFFITYDKQHSLDNKYTIFGKVIDGFEALEAMERVKSEGKLYRPTQEFKIKTITIHANPIAEEQRQES